MNTNTFYIETYGCQMNVADSELVAAILRGNQYTRVLDPADASLILLNTCSVRDNAEQRVLGRLHTLAGLKKKNPRLLLGIMGCMAERLGDDLLRQEPRLDLVIGPDAYRRLPDLLLRAADGQPAVDTELSTTETYPDICPSRLDSTAISGFVSITRGCNNFCTYCIVPYTRGRERSRPPRSILGEIDDLQTRGYKEVTLLGQNVNSYHYTDTAATTTFPDLLHLVAATFPGLRIRFATSHPKDMTDDILHVIASHPNVCHHIHLPVQSGSNRILQLMNRRYTREWYLERVRAIRTIIPDCAISTDVFVGFHDESDDDFQQTLALMREVRFDSAFTFKYSERPGTFAARHLPDNVPEDVKASRLQQLIDLQVELSHQSNLHDVDRHFQILVEGPSHKNPRQLFGRTSQNKVVVFSDNGARPGDRLLVQVTACTPATLIGIPVTSQPTGNR